MADWTLTAAEREAQGVPEGRRALARRIAALAWDEGVDAAYRGAVTRQNAEDVKGSNPYRKGVETQ